MTENKYAVVTCISTFRIRYVVPLDETLDENQNVENASDSVVMEEVREFSQEHIAENIVDRQVLSEDEVLKMFDTENQYLSDWPRSQKLDYIKNWKES